MSSLNAISFSAEEISLLRRQFSALDDVMPFFSKSYLAERVASLGIVREVGSVNDELARFIFSHHSGTVVERTSLRAELVEWRDFIGVRIWSEQTDRLELRAKWFHELLQPKFSYDENGDLYQLVIFPRIVAKIAAARGVETVLVKSWGLNSIFGGFDPAKDYYKTNFWELENNDSLIFAKLISQGQVALLGTHDLIAHLAGIDSSKWQLLKQQAGRVYSTIAKYFANTRSPSISALILPYTLGVVLDDLAQPPTYGSPSHSLMLEFLLNSLENCRIPPDRAALLSSFPKSFERVIQLSRDRLLTEHPKDAERAVGDLLDEILGQTS